MNILSRRSTHSGRLERWLGTDKIQQLVDATSGVAPLASGDTGIMDWNQMQCDALVATGLVNFVIGHPLGFMALPAINLLFPFDWLTNRNQAPRIFADAYLSFLELKPAATATTYSGVVYMTSTSS